MIQFKILFEKARSIYQAMITEGFHDPDFLVEAQFMIPLLFQWVFITCKSQSVYIFKIKHISIYNYV